MSELNSVLSSVLQRALDALKKARADVYTFSFCHDRARGAVFVCADSALSSRRVIGKLNRSSMKRFANAVQKRDLEAALMWQATVGRSLSPQEFLWPNLGRRSLGKFKQAPELHEAMLLTAIQVVPKVVELTVDSEALLFTCSTADEEVGLVWTADAATKPRAARLKTRTR
jgi:hypothetical protein